MKLYIKQKGFSRGDSYEIDIAVGTDEVLALSVVLVMDAIMAENQKAAAENND